MHSFAALFLVHAARGRTVSYSAAVLLMLLQRIPVVRLVLPSASHFASSISQTLRTTAISAAALGGIDTLVGATQLTANPASPVSLNHGTPFQAALAVTGAPLVPGSYEIAGELPPGLNIPGRGANGVVNAQTFTITGTPGATGTYTLNIRAWEGANRTGHGGTPTFPYVINVIGGPQPPPRITLQPRSFRVSNGTAVLLEGEATGATSLQWQRNGTPIPGATQPVLVIDRATSAEAGAYTLVARNADASTTSSVANLTVVSELPGRIVNLSVRTQLAPGQRLTMGFTAAGDKTVLLRGAGPTLTTLTNGSVVGHPNPRIELQANGVRLAENEDWPASLSSQFSALGAFPFQVGSRDAALSRSIAGGNTATIEGPGSGIVLMEVYDAGGEGRLFNVSARNHVGTGADALFAGFVMHGDVAKTLLIRAIGPVLRNFGIGDALTDPKLEIFKPEGTGNVKIAENDDWDAARNAFADRAGAAGLPIPAGNKDSGLVITLEPGQYTAVVSGVNGATGQALVEIYEIP